MIPSRTLYRLALAAALAGALGLGACGRKGPLDVPPSAAVTPAPAAPHATMLTPRASTGQVERSPNAPEVAPEDRTFFGDATGRERNNRPVAPKGEKKHLPLDVLLD